MIWVQLVLSFAESLIKSRIGQMIVLALVVWFWSAHNTATYWKGIIAQEKAAVEAAYRAEVARQQAAAQEIAQAATVRAEEDAKAVADMQQVINNYEKSLKENHHVAAPADCVVDDNFANVVQQLSRTPHRSSKIARPSSGIRKAR